MRPRSWRVIQLGTGGERVDFRRTCEVQNHASLNVLTLTENTLLSWNQQHRSHVSRRSSVSEVLPVVWGCRCLGRNLYSATRWWLFFCVEIDATCIWMHATTAMKRAAALARLHEDPTVETKLRHFGSASSSGVTGTHRRRAGKRCGPMFCILKCAPGKRKMAFKLQHRHLIKPALPQIWSSDNRLLLLTWICGRETGNCTSFSQLSRAANIRLSYRIWCFAVD